MTFTIHRLGTCVSTNEEAKDRARNGAPEGTVIVADEQTGGKGTKGRTWYSPSGAGLYVSVILRPGMDVSLSLLPLAAGLAAREAMERASGLSTLLRWPNDLVWEGKKIGGILCEGGLSGFQMRYTVVGLGINLIQAEGDFPQALRGKAASLFQAAGGLVDRETLLGAFLEELESAAAPIFEKRTLDIIDAFLRHSEEKLGDPLSVQSAAGTFQGAFAGLDPDGAVRIAGPDGERRFVSAEILSFGPASK
ncbi:MAG: biotin--[acetyl-CoA-carboxylase] ligase [Candidatus Aminicenantes bacterium]|nr:biotin--[acetyl-CoA-carboxylase] ligase [Candidatus Aminicenantes bacterium]